MGDVMAMFAEDEGEILLTFSEDLFVFDDIYALPIELAQKLMAQLDAALREATGPHGKLFRNRKPSVRSAKVKRAEATGGNEFD